MIDLQLDDYQLMQYKYLKIFKFLTVHMICLLFICNYVTKKQFNTSIIDQLIK